MFTGLIEAVGELAGREATSGGSRLRIRSILAPSLSNGDSVAVNGVCLTVTLIEDDVIQADIGPETMRVTTLGGLSLGARVNLERPLAANARLGGHFVQGHVDGVGRIEELRPESDFLWVAVSFPAALASYIIPKGSIAVDGISLTVAALGSDRFDAQVIPYTLQNTNLAEIRGGERVNLECDLVGKYVVRAMEVAGSSMMPVRSR
jgi:riboflavin synthase